MAPEKAPKLTREEFHRALDIGLDRMLQEQERGVNLTISDGLKYGIQQIVQERLMFQTTMNVPIRRRQLGG